MRTVQTAAMTRFRILLATLLYFGLALGAEADSPRPAQPPPRHEVTIGPKDMVFAPLARRLFAHVETAAAAEQEPVIGPIKNAEAARLLRSLYARGQAAGLAGVLYDNRDGSHSPLPTTLFPQVTWLRYAPELTERKLNRGLADSILFDKVTIGNSSTAYKRGFAPRSLARGAMTRSPGALKAFQAYAANQIYVYPEHRDHDAVDLYPANWPYMFISEGSSYRDQPILQAVAMILAALRPDTRAMLEERRLIAPTVQMVFRRAQTSVRSRAAYLEGDAHPSVFGPEAIQLTRMIALANSLKPEDIPPMVELSVTSEQFSDKAGLDQRSERLFDTPSAIARVWRGPDFSRQMVVSAARTQDPNGRALTFDWVLLRGDPAHVRIVPLDAAGTAARLEFDWQEARPVSARDPRLTSRVDIGVFAWNGVHDSAPAFVSVSFPTHQARRYEPGPDGAQRLAEVDYDAIGRGAAFDPILHWSAPWRDVQVYDAKGKPAGWLRIGPGKVTRFDARGDLAGGQAVVYRAAPVGNTAVVVSMLGSEPDSQ